MGFQVPKPIENVSFFNSIHELLVDIYVTTLTAFPEAFSSKLIFLLLELLFWSYFGFLKGLLFKVNI